MNHVIILSGVSGSGKSTYAKSLEPYAIVSADHCFMCDGVYVFDVTKLSLAHGACFRRFIGFLQENENRTLVVDNTNTTTEEIAPYVLGAQAFDATVEIRTLRGGYANVHGTPLDTVAKQAIRLASRVLPPWWKHSYV